VSLAADVNDFDNLLLRSSPASIILSLVRNAGEDKKSSIGFLKVSCPTCSRY
jgi:hypothetical protein